MFDGASSVASMTEVLKSQNMPIPLAAVEAVNKRLVCPGLTAWSGRCKACGKEANDGHLQSGPHMEKVRELFTGDRLMGESEGARRFEGGTGTKGAEYLSKECMYKFWGPRVHHVHLFVLSRLRDGAPMQLMCPTKGGPLDDVEGMTKKTAGKAIQPPVGPKDIRATALWIVDYVGEGKYIDAKSRIIPWDGAPPCTSDLMKVAALAPAAGWWPLVELMFTELYMQQHPLVAALYQAGCRWFVCLYQAVEKEMQAWPQLIARSLDLEVERKGDLGWDHLWRQGSTRRDGFSLRGGSEGRRCSRCPQTRVPAQAALHGHFGSLGGPLQVLCPGVEGARWGWRPVAGRRRLGHPTPGG
jgi:hypothetical protein